jgi:hypothetical protein
MVEQDALVAASPVSRQLYTELLTAIKPIGPSRWHLDVRLTACKDFDSELLGWLRQAYDLCM